MKFQLPLIAVRDLERSKAFYQQVLGQRVMMDLGANVSFEGFAVQQGYDMLVGEPGFAVGFERQNNHELYFEEDDYESILVKMEGRDDIDYVHRSKEYPWGQRVMRFYDPDGHIIELAESMPSVFRKFSAQGMSAEQVAERTEHPLEFVYSILG